VKLLFTVCLTNQHEGSHILVFTRSVTQRILQNKIKMKEELLIFLKWT